MTEGFKRILLIEDNQGDARLVREMLRDAGGFELSAAQDMAAGLTLAAGAGFDAAVLDLGLPDIQGLETYLRLHAAAPDLPVIILTLSSDQADAREAIKQGAQDFLFKHDLTPGSLVRSIDYAIERARLRAELQESRRRYQAVSEVVASYSYEKTLTPDGGLVLAWISEGFEKITGHRLLGGDDVHGIRGKITHPDDVPTMNAILGKILRGETAVAEFRVWATDGRTVWVHCVERPVYDASGRVTGSIGAASDITARKAIETAAEESRRRYQAISEITSDYVYEKRVGDDGVIRIAWVSDQFTRITGFTVGEMTEVSAVQAMFIHPDDRERLQAMNRETLKGRTGNIDFRIITRDGVEKWMREVERPAPDETGRITTIFGGVSDVTARKRAEVELSAHRENLERLVDERSQEIIRINRQLSEKIQLQHDAEKSLRRARQILDNIFDTTHLQIAYLDRNFNFIRVNRAYAKSAGAPEDFFPGRNHFQLYPHQENEVIFRKVRDSGEPYTIFAKPFSFPGHPEWGVTYWDWSLTPIKGPDGQVEEIIFALQDVTRTIMSEHALADEKQRLFNVLETLPAAVHIVDRDHNIGFANKIFRERFGQIEDRKCWQVLHHRDSVCPDCGADSIFAGQVREVQAEITPVDGRVYEVYARRLSEEGGDRVLKMAIDVTDRKKAEAERAVAEERLEEQRTRAIFADRLRNLGQMATSIAHELNQPLVGVRGLAEHIGIAVKRGWRLPDADLIEKAQMIVDQADRMSAIIEHSRMFVRGSQTQTLEKVDLNQVIKSALTMLSGQLRAHGFDLRLELGEDLPPVLANQYSLEEVVINLVGNARDACGDKKFATGGPVLTITSSRNGGDGVKVEVEDNGPGIDPETLPRVFDPFFTTKEIDRGTGLGLAISRSIVENYRGRLSVESEPGAGARFTMTLPAVENR